MRLPPSVSAGKLRRAVVNAGAVTQVLLPGLKTSTSVEGLGATLPPPKTFTWLVRPTARVSPAGLGIGALLPMVLVAGVKLNELVESMTLPFEKSDAPAT